MSYFAKLYKAVNEFWEQDLKDGQTKLRRKKSTHFLRCDCDDETNELSQEMGDNEKQPKIQAINTHTLHFCFAVSGYLSLSTVSWIVFLAFSPVLYI